MTKNTELAIFNEEAIQKEKERIEAEKRAEEEAQRQREEDIKHRASIHRDIESKLCDLFITKPPLDNSIIKALIKEIAKGTIPHLTIKY